MGFALRFSIFAVSFFFLSSLQAKSELTPPDEKGPYNVGFRNYPNIIPGSEAKIPRAVVFYPTQAPSDCLTEYTLQTPRGPYQRSSPLCAAENAQPVPSEAFPMVIHDHGGGSAGSDSQLFGQLILHETLASHGFIVVAYRHSAVATTRVKDVPKIIDYMLSGDNPLSASVDPERIGMSGLSTGGRTTLAVTGGWVAPFNNHPPIPADPRIKAMVLFEPGRDNSLEDIATISIPYLVMGGTRIVNGTVTVPEVFATTVLATPRIYVKNQEALHLGYQSDACDSVEETREAALELDPEQPEPLTNLVPNPSNPQLRVCNPAMGAAAFQACTTWNQGELFLPVLGPTAFGFGSGRNMCRLVGVDPDSARPLDNDPLDGFTDDFVPGTEIRLFEPNDAFNSDEFTPGPSMPADILVPMIKHYSVAFFKKFLAGDGRYMRHLTPGYANVSELEATVEIRE